MANHCLFCLAPVAEPSTHSGPDLCSALLRNYFVLKHILGLPQGQICYYLTATESGPNSWISLCAECSTNYVQEGFKLYAELKDTERKLNLIKCQVKKLIEESSKTETAWENSWHWSISEEARKYVRNRSEIIVQENPFLDGDVLASQCLAGGPIKLLSKSSSVADADLPVVKQEFDSHGELDNDDHHFDVDEFSASLSGDDIDAASKIPPPPSSAVPLPITKKPHRPRPPKPILIKKRVIDPKDLTCPKCSRVYLNRDSFMYHMKYTDCVKDTLTNGPGKREYRCPHCNKVYIVKAHFNFHQFHCKLKKQPMDGITAGLDDDAGAPAAAPDEAPPPPSEPTCPTCNFTFRYHFHLRRHLKKGTCKPGSAPDFVCPKCLRNFLTALSLQKHSCEEKIYTCDQCPFKSTRFYVTAYHKLTAHRTPQDGDEVNCPNCCKVFSTSKLHLFEYHVRICRKSADPSKKGSKKRYGLKWECDLCDRTFSKESILEDHRVAVHSEKGYLCSECGFQTKAKKLLQRHIRWTHDPRQDKSSLSCPVCKKTFATPYYVKEHVAVAHNPDRTRSVCELCGKTFGAKYTLRMHMASKHTNESAAGQLLQHQCGKCGKFFYFKSSRDKHEAVCGNRGKGGRPRKVRADEENGERAQAETRGGDELPSTNETFENLQFQVGSGVL